MNKKKIGVLLVSCTFACYAHSLPGLLAFSFTYPPILTEVYISVCEHRVNFMPEFTPVQQNKCAKLHCRVQSDKRAEQTEEDTRQQSY